MIQTLSRIRASRGQGIRVVLMLATLFMAARAQSVSPGVETSTPSKEANPHSDQGDASSNGGGGTAEPVYDSYFMYLGEHPHDKSPGWHAQTQGVSHDQDHWYISQRDRIWRIPVTHDLNDNASEYPSIALEDVPALAAAGYDHLGDLAWYAYPPGGNGYLAIAVEDNDYAEPDERKRGSVAVFRADDTLGYVGHGELASPTWPDRSTCAWVAIDAEGLLYTAHDDTAFEVYRLDWPLLHNTGTLQVTHERSHPILDANGDPLPFDNSQGAAFSLNGAMFYVVCGNGSDWLEWSGIHAFDTTTWRRVRQSQYAMMPFAFQYSPGNLVDEEPEGMTVWDLDTDTRAPNISGQLHVFMLDNEASHSDDSVFFKHYSHTIHADGEYSGYVDIPMSAFGVTPIEGLVWYNAENEPQSTFYLDDIAIIRPDGKILLYVDSLAAGWQGSALPTEVDWSNPVPFHGRSGTSIAVTFETILSYLSLSADVPLDLPSGCRLQFAVHGGDLGRHQIGVNAFRTGVEGTPWKLILDVGDAGLWYGENGRPTTPFKTIREAYDTAWDGQKLAIQSGTYAETLTMSKKLALTAVGGLVTIGQSNDAQSAGSDTAGRLDRSRGGAQR